MFTAYRTEIPGGFIEYRKENLTGLQARICPQRLQRGINIPAALEYQADGCPFCPDQIDVVTPTFPDGTRIRVGESVTFPNLYPFAAFHVVTTITASHMVTGFTRSQVVDALFGQVKALWDQKGYISINWNFLPSAGASLPHPHLQGIADSRPDTLLSRYLDAGSRCRDESGRRYSDLLMDHEQKGERTLTGNRLFWYAHPVPVGEREIRCVLPLTTVREFLPYIDDFASDIVRILGFYRKLGTHAFNMAVFFGTGDDRDDFSAFCSIISRINPNPLSTSDTAFMERLHLEPVIMTLPEDLASVWSDLMR